MEFRVANTARVAGALYLIVILCAGFAQIVRTALIEPGDATATADNIRDSLWLFRVGFTSDIVAFSADIALALALYLLLRPVNAGLALLAALFRVGQAAVLGINMLNQFAVLLILDGAEYLSVFSEAQLDALTLFFLDAHAYGYLIGLVFFGLSSFVLGYLVYKSGYLPRIFGILLMAFVAGGYLLDSLLSFLGSESDALSMVLIAPAALVEISFCLWLLIKGGEVVIPPDESAAPSGASRTPDPRFAPAHR